MMVMHCWSRRRRGFTLLETLVAATLFTVFSITLSQLLMGGMATFKKGQAISSLRADLRSTLDVMARDFRSATGGDVVYPPLNAGYQKYSDCLEFTRASQAAQGQPNSSVKVGDVVYTLNYANGTLVREADGADPVLLAENLLIGERIGEQAGTNPRSYFAWVVNQTSDEYQRGNVMEMRLTGAKYIGTELQTMSVVTYANYRSAETNAEGFVGDLPNVNWTRVGLFKASDLAQPRVGRAYFQGRL